MQKHNIDMNSLVFGFLFGSRHTETVGGESTANVDLMLNIHQFQMHINFYIYFSLHASNISSLFIYASQCAVSFHSFSQSLSSPVAAVVIVISHYSTT